MQICNADIPQFRKGNLILIRPDFHRLICFPFIFCYIFNSNAFYCIIFFRVDVANLYIYIIYHCISAIFRSPLPTRTALPWTTGRRTTASQTSSPQRRQRVERSLWHYFIRSLWHHFISTTHETVIHTKKEFTKYSHDYKL